MASYKKQVGDTLVEVLLATVVIASVIAGAYALTNRATRNNQAALERTYVSNLLKEQTEFIRGIRASGVGGAAWESIIDKYTINSAPTYDDANFCTFGTNAFYINRAADNLLDENIVSDYTPGNTPGSDPEVDIYEMWVEAYRPEPEYIDFHVRACWTGQGDIGPQRESIILRLNT